MSANHQTSEHTEDHTGPVKTPKQFLLMIIFSFVVPVFAIIGLAYFVVTQFKPIAGANNEPKVVEQRIAKIGTVEVKDGNAPLATGEKVYATQCIACHGSGAAGAPKYQEKGAWSARIGKGYEALLTSALKGKGNMGAQGGGDFDDVEIGRAVVFMANANGAKFAIPDRPAPTPEAAAK
ncbi:MAG: c-type cytochrome [Cytophagales bacterium]|nr:c-type cytochrome [Cytophagales bacterium]